MRNSSVLPLYLSGYLGPPTFKAG